MPARPVPPALPFSSRVDLQNLTLFSLETRGSLGQKKGKKEKPWDPILDNSQTALPLT